MSTIRAITLALSVLLMTTGFSYGDFVLSIEEGTNDADTGDFHVRLKATADMPELIDFEMSGFAIDMQFDSLPGNANVGFPMQIEARLPDATPDWQFFTLGGGDGANVTVADGGTVSWTAIPQLGANNFFTIPAEGLEILWVTYDPPSPIEGTKGLEVSIVAGSGSPAITGPTAPSGELVPLYDSSPTVLPSTAIPEPSSFILIGLIASVVGGFRCFQILSGRRSVE